MFIIVCRLFPICPCCSSNILVSLSRSLSLPLHESLQQQPAAKPTSFVLCRNNKSIHSPSSVFILVTQTLVPHFRLKHEIWWKHRATWPVGIVFIILYSPCAHSGWIERTFDYCHYSLYHSSCSELCKHNFVRFSQHGKAMERRSETKQTSRCCVNIILTCSIDILLWVQRAGAWNRPICISHREKDRRKPI